MNPAQIEQNPINLIPLAKIMILESLNQVFTEVNPSLADMLQAILSSDKISVDQSHKFGLDNMAAVYVIMDGAYPAIISQRFDETKKVFNNTFIGEKFCDDLATLSYIGFEHRKAVQKLNYAANILGSQENIDYQAFIKDTLASLDIENMATEISLWEKENINKHKNTTNSGKLFLEFSLMAYYEAVAFLKQQKSLNSEFAMLFEFGIIGFTQRYPAMDLIMCNYTMGIKEALRLQNLTIWTDSFAGAIAMKALAAKNTSYHDLYEQVKANQSAIINAIKTQSEIIRLFNDGGTAVVDKPETVIGLLEQLIEELDPHNQLNPVELFQELERQYQRLLKELHSEFNLEATELSKHHIEEILANPKNIRVKTFVRLGNYRNYFSRLVKDAIEREYNPFLYSQMPRHWHDDDVILARNQLKNNLLYGNTNYQSARDKFVEQMKNLKILSAIAYDFLGRFVYFNYELYILTSYKELDLDTFLHDSASYDYDRVVRWETLLSMTSPYSSTMKWEELI